jgi:RND family efflux transporter MFP subunit
VVGLPQVDPGDRVTPDTAVTVLDNRRRLWVGFDLPEADAARLRTGHPVRATSPGVPGLAIEGRVLEVDNRLDPATRSLRMRADLPNAGDRLRAGMSFTVRLDLPGQPRRAVPDIALQMYREGPFVWVVREGRARSVPVTLLQRRDGVVLVDGPIADDDRVVTEGVQRLRPGCAAKPVESTP